MAEIENIEKANKEAHQGMAKLEKDAKPIEGAECKVGGVKALASLLKLAKEDKALESIKNLERMELEMDVAYGKVMNVNKTLRLGNEVKILALKASRAVFQKGLDDANKEIKKLKKSA